MGPTDGEPFTVEERLPSRASSPIPRSSTCCKGETLGSLETIPAILSVIVHKMSIIQPRADKRGPEDRSKRPISTLPVSQYPRIRDAFVIALLLLPLAVAAQCPSSETQNPNLGARPVLQTVALFRESSLSAFEIGDTLRTVGRSRPAGEYHCLGETIFEGGVFTVIALLPFKSFRIYVYRGPSKFLLLTRRLGVRIADFPAREIIIFNKVVLVGPLAGKRRDEHLGPLSAGEEA